MGYIVRNPNGRYLGIEHDNGCREWLHSLLKAEAHHFATRGEAKTVLKAIDRRPDARPMRAYNFEKI